MKFFNAKDRGVSVLAGLVLWGASGGWLGMPGPARGQEAGQRQWSQEVKEALGRAGPNREELVRALGAVPEERRRGLEFLLENMPGEDLETLSGSFLLEHLELAYEARAKARWGSSIPEELFLNYVLPYASVNERRDEWRKPLRDLCQPLVEECLTGAEAAQRLNQKLFQQVGVKYSTKRNKADQSPLETMESGLASCTGLSILLVDGCRSVGVPARLVGIPNWVDKRGNHTWVEIWDGEWHFTGAAEPDGRGLDHGWFEGDAAQAIKDSKEHAIYATSFARTPVAFPLVWAEGLDYVSAVNVTDRYARAGAGPPPAKVGLRVKVWDRRGGNRVAAAVEVIDLGENGARCEGTSKDEKFDLNDILSFDLEAKRAYEVRVKFGGRSWTQRYESAEKGADEVEIYLEEAVPSEEGKAGSDFVPGRREVSSGEEAELRGAVRNFFEAEERRRGGWEFDARLEKLLKSDEVGVRKLVWEAYKEAPIHGVLREDYDGQQVRFGDYVSAYTVEAVGEKPGGGWPLFIAMHGGGGTAKEVNDQQWRVMQRYYREQESVGGYLYLALRAPNDRWNGFYDGYVYPLVAKLIGQFVLFGEVNPEKVFLMGYSHGGYGAFAIGPKMPDRFAAIHSSAAAPTDGETSAVTLRNTVFTYMIGENDHAYGRLKRCEAFNAWVGKLKGDRAGIYPVTMEFKPGFGHRGLPDRDKIKDMYEAVRVSVPKELSWEMTDGVVKDFYWLSVPEPGKKQEVWGSCRDNTVTLSTTNVARLYVNLDGRLVDFDRPVTIRLNGEAREERVQPRLRTLCQGMLERGDPGLAFSARVELKPLANRE